MGFGSRAFLAGGLGFAVAFVAACGGGAGLLSTGESSTLASQLSSISASLVAHQCVEASNGATALNNAIANLPPSVSTTLVRNLGQGAALITQLVGNCTPNASTSTSTSSSTSSTSSTSTPTTTTTTTTTSPTSSSSSSSSSSSATGTGTSPATNPPSSSTSSTSTSNGGAGLGGIGTAGGGGTGGSGK